MDPKRQRAQVRVRVHACAKVAHAPILMLCVYSPCFQRRCKKNISFSFIKPKGGFTLGFCYKEFITQLCLITKYYNPTDGLYNMREDGNEFLVESYLKFLPANKADSDSPVQFEGACVNFASTCALN